MAEYIEREAALHAILGEPTESHYPSWYAERIKALPAADVAPVVHGHWIWHEEEFEYECSACHCRFDYNHTFEIFDHGFQYANHCPVCGAKMDGGADND